MTLEGGVLGHDANKVWLCAIIKLELFVPVCMYVWLMIICDAKEGGGRWSSLNIIMTLKISLIDLDLPPCSLRFSIFHLCNPYIPNIIYHR